MNKSIILYIVIFYSLFSNSFIYAQNDKKTIVEFEGQLSSYTQYAPMDKHYTVLGARYIPELNIYAPNKTKALFDFQIAADISGYIGYQGDNGFLYDGAIKPYRAWVRYRSESFELRLGLQKIDFGSSTLLRPLQWFNSTDPRDPLALTNGVWGLLARYYWLNNANLWFWCLSLNDELRGLDILNSHKYLPEFGGRFQYPIPRGEIALSYNHRWVDATHFNPSYKDVQEEKVGLDAKWDVVVGLWFEATYSYLHQPLSYFTHQEAFNIGVDYTFACGNGLNLSIEHLLLSYDQKAFNFEKVSNISALQMNYPIAMFDTISLMGFYDWKSESVSAFLSYMHSFKYLSLYTNLYYNPKKELNFYERTDFQMGQGVGLQIMLVFNH